MTGYGLLWALLLATSPSNATMKSATFAQTFIVAITDVRTRTPRTWRRQIDLNCRRERSGPRCILEYRDVDECGRPTDGRAKERIEYASGYANAQWDSDRIVLTLGRSDFNHQLVLRLDLSSRVVAVAGGGYDETERNVTKWSLVSAPIPSRCATGSDSGRR